ncbi:hypothetical protein CLOM_g18908 [Closterium sp. NIES-68]|nr:hypothetical protein CLOM_g18908 [Closterium sp. NIES-68]
MVGAVATRAPPRPQNRPGTRRAANRQNPVAPDLARAHGVTEPAGLPLGERVHPPQHVPVRSANLVHIQKRRRTANVHRLPGAESANYQLRDAHGVLHPLWQLRVHSDALWPHERALHIPTHHEWRIPKSAQQVCHRLFDDILIHSKTREHHLKDLEQVFQRLQQNRLITKGSKCEFLKSEREFLGHVVGADGIKIDPTKILTIRDWKPPTNLQELQSFLGFVNYVRRFIPNMAGITGPLTDLLRKGTSFEWGERQQTVFYELRNCMTSPPVLRIADPSRPFEVLTDASDFAIGAILLQDFSEGLQPIAYESRKLQAAECNYPVHDKEMLAIVHAFKVWRCYLTGADVTVRTDHKSLQYLRAQPNLNPRQIRWLDFFESNFHYTITYKRGANNIADALTRPSAHLASIPKIQPSFSSPPLFECTVCHQRSSATATQKFASKFWQETWAQYSTRLQFSSAYHPQTDGQTERTNQTMEQLIRTNCPDPSRWEESLPMLEFSYNNAPCATTNHSPFFLNYGMDPTSWARFPRGFLILLSERNKAQFIAVWVRACNQRTQIDLLLLRLSSCCTCVYHCSKASGIPPMAPTAMSPLLEGDASYYVGEKEPGKKDSVSVVEVPPSETIPENETNGTLESRREWSTGIFSCVPGADEHASSDCEICCLGMFAPCVLYGSNMTRLTGNPHEFYDSCLRYTSLFILGKCLLHCNALAPIASWPSRSAVRSQFRLQSGAEDITRDPSEGCHRSCDCMLHFFCHRCALCQEAREIRRYLPPLSGPGSAAATRVATVAPTTQAMNHKN